MIQILRILAIAALCRMCGGGLGVDKFPRWFNRIPEMLFALPFGCAAYTTTGSPLFCVLGAVWTFTAMELGHGNGYHDGVLETQYPDRWQTLDYIVRPITDRLGFSPRSMGYCRIFMGAKGLLIGLPVFPAGLPLAGLWPLAYAISFRVMKRDSGPAEWISGAFAGVVLAWCYS